ncbi:MAG TPA: universal stress protein [Vicinamibacterales bacterium]|nr:universal stress protein [Vicinamibacterales bacterium]
MLPLRTVLCPVDFSPATGRQIDLAADVCRAFGARLVLHHNRHSLGTGASVGWMWNADHHGECRATLEARLQEWLTRVPADVGADGLITEGPVSRAVLAVGEAVGADLVVLTAHGSSPEDHASVTEKLLEEGQRAVLVLHEPEVEPRTPHFASPGGGAQVVLAPTDLMPQSRAAVELGLDLARTLPLDLHLLHVLPNGRARGAAGDDALAQLGALVPQDLVGRVALHVEHGDPAKEIARAADQLAAACIVMGEHARTPLRRWFSRDTSRAVLRQAHCPVWYVPGTRAA